MKCSMTGPRFLDHSDHDYKSPSEAEDKDSDGGYESPTEVGPQNREGDRDSDNDYDAPPSELSDNLPHCIFPTKPLGISAQQFGSSARTPMVPHPKPEDEQDIDLRWYVGQVTREQVDDYLRWVGQDGAFLIRDSSKGSTTQPYTLMVLHQGKVYNTQIRYHSDQNIFTLDTGLKCNKSYSGVTQIVQHHMRKPLLLIESKEQGSGPQRQCPTGCCPIPAYNTPSITAHREDYREGDRES
ncbi:hypothetical protein AAFF_G00309850 [Aldrovandia affinis]|uniref:SH2 domain-containing protein n=1 Tax=Aldrovandia affinis TaxID=143900 RepID=A0AAD7SNS2_9TELE|nr:hypothetical protein AAFF_G00309850 [Aldrovandia affinis]